MRRANLRRRCQRLINDLEIPEPFDLDCFRRQLAGQRGRPLKISPLPALAEPGFVSGVWVATENADYILYNARTSPLHQRHIIMHEVGHMIFRHNEHELPEGVMRSSEFPNIYSRPGGDMTARINYSKWEEVEAEMAATLLVEAIGVAPRPSRFTGILAELETLLGFSRA
ncbi:ImmA/IrrE family metallo-endopeptidase [Salinispora arenicola]|uniref:ImmA/IrrE family metallo-endopeptidase n=1 Tax=Salinispora arenicola TaxID=168697 RepID=UPI0004759F33|nr:ImmA/IrrE family metallo-endopeptidase [Salinispora arenicola]